MTSDTIRNKAKEVAKVLNIPNKEFKASRGWMDRFMKRAGDAVHNMPKVSSGFGEKNFNHFSGMSSHFGKKRIFRWGKWQR